MVADEILQAIREQGLLLEKSVMDIVQQFDDPRVAKNFLEQLSRASGQKMLTRTVLTRNSEIVKSLVAQLPGEQQTVMAKVFFNLGVQLEVRHEFSSSDQSSGKEKVKSGYHIFYADTRPEKKLEVGDFTNYFRVRYQAMQRILMQRPELQNNLVSINKIASDRTSLSIIGMVTSKRATKNKNLILTVEDLTGSIQILIRNDKTELLTIGEELRLDDIIGIKASGSRDMLFAHDIFFPDSILHEKHQFNEDVRIAFLSDFHAGSDRHLKKSVQKFLNWLNSGDEVASKVKYIFFTGDNVDGVGIFPGQEDVLELKSMKEQYALLASYLRQVPKHITMFMCPGQHDAVRVAEPQPLISKKYAPELYEIENLVLVTNPTMVKFFEGEKVFKVLMYHGASIHTFINEIKELREMKAHKCPAQAVRHMLKRRHLAPTHSDTVYIPNADSDPLVIHEVPDVLCTGEVHRLDIDNYNGIYIITGSCWQAQTPFEEKIGNVPDPAKVPVFSLKTRELKVYDFGVEEEIKAVYGGGAEQEAGEDD